MKGREGETEELCVAHYTITHHLNDSSYCTVHTYFQAHALGAFGSAYLLPCAYSALLYTCLYSYVVCILGLSTLYECKNVAFTKINCHVCIIPSSTN